MEEKKGRKNFQSQGGESNPTTVTLKGKAPVCIATFTLLKDPCLQLLYEYHERYILNTIYSTISNAHEGETERESVIELNLKVQKTIQYSSV